MSPIIVRVPVVIFLVLILSCCSSSTKQKEPTLSVKEIITEEPVEIDSSKIAYSFDFPVGKPDAKGYYDYQGFTKNNHLGEDWNGVGGGNTDLGDTIYAIGNGIVTYAEDFKGGWGNTVRIVHELPDGKCYESIYTHCDTLLTSKSTWLQKGEPIGTIGTANGQYYAHLHLELREVIGMPIGNGYATDTTGYLNPTAFIKSHREMVVLDDSSSTSN
jgi:murein DD-endopeptidase MepM/ murein hydrolase activator NlpD